MSVLVHYACGSGSVAVQVGAEVISLSGSGVVSLPSATFSGSLDLSSVVYPTPYTSGSASVGVLVAGGSWVAYEAPSHQVENLLAWGSAGACLGISLALISLVGVVMRRGLFVNRWGSE
jgi:hypothetical protein